MLTKVDAEYLNIIDDINKHGEYHNDRTGVGTKRVFGRMFKFNLEEEFPAITCKPIAFKNTVRELLYFLGGDPHLDSLKELGGSCFKWWSPFIKEDGTIGPLYPTQWRNLEVDKSTRQAIPVLKKVYTPVKNNVKSFDEKLSIDGCIYKSNNSGDFIIFNKYKKKEQDTFYSNDIQFIKTGFIKIGIATHIINKKAVYDPFYPRVNGVGFKGEAIITTELDKNIYRIWVDMLARCFNPSNKSYKNYGAKGVTVCPSWFNFSIFLSDIQNIPGWINKKLDFKNYVLDKDYYASKVYSKDTCVWLNKKDNIIYSTRNKPFKAICKNTGAVYIDISQKKFGEKYNIDASRISDCLNNKDTYHKKYKFEYIQYDEDKYVYRYPLPIDQIQNCIDLIKQDPGSRRICFTGWNPQDLYKQNLYACHSSFVQFMVSNDNKLHMSTIQRSADVSLGLCHNWVSYAILQIMIARVCNLIPGELTYFVNDLHIYQDHLEPMLKMPAKSYSEPYVEVDKLDSINKYTLDNIRLFDYKAGPKIKLNMAV